MLLATKIIVSYKFALVNFYESFYFQKNFYKKLVTNQLY